MNNFAPNSQVTTETTSIIKNFTLDGVKALKADKVTNTFEATYHLNPKTNKRYKVVNLVDKKVEPISFNLIEVTPKEIAVYRKNGVPSFVLKTGGKLYHTRIPKTINFLSYTISGTVHQCAGKETICNRLSAASDEQGGCAKVRDYYDCIEKYPWIATGYETFNTKYDSFIVVNCLHYEPFYPRKKISNKQLYRTKLDLAQNLWPDVECWKDVLERLKVNIPWEDYKI